jgi:hypothetical protein
VLMVKAVMELRLCDVLSPCDIPRLGVGDGDVKRVGRGRKGRWGEGGLSPTATGLDLSNCWPAYTPLHPA